MIRFTFAALIALALLTVPASASEPETVRTLMGRDAYTMTVLHPDEARSRLYTVNYQLPGYLPLCTRVRIQTLTADEMTFKVIETGRVYEYLNHRSNRAPLENHLMKFFGRSCDPRAIERLSARDQEGIALGKGLPGMTKEGILLAMGYPPEHRTPNLKLPEWIFWRSRFDTFKLHFNAEGVLVRQTD